MVHVIREVEGKRQHIVVPVESLQNKDRVTDSYGEPIRDRRTLVALASGDATLYRSRYLGRG